MKFACRDIRYITDRLTRHEKAFLKSFLSGVYAGVILHEIYNCEFYMDFWRFMNGSSLKIMFFLRFLLIILDRRSKACRHCSSDGRTGRGQLLAGQNFPRNAFDFELVECQSLDRPGGHEEK